MNALSRALFLASAASAAAAADPAQTGTPAAKPVGLKASASLWSGTACDAVPNRPKKLSFSGSFSMGACPGKGTVVRVEIANTGDAEQTVTVRGLDSLRVKAASKAVWRNATGFGLSTPNPMGGGSHTSVANSIEGSLGFGVAGGESFSLLVLFPAAAVGDTVQVGDAPAAVIRAR